MIANVGVFEPAIRALSDSTPTPLREQKANGDAAADNVCGKRG